MRRVTEVRNEGMRRKGVKQAGGARRKRWRRTRKRMTKTKGRENITGKKRRVAEVRSEGKCLEERSETDRTIELSAV